MKKSIILGALLSLLFAALLGVDTSKSQNEIGSKVSWLSSFADPTFPTRIQHRSIRQQSGRSPASRSAQISPTWAWAIGGNSTDEARGILPLDEGGFIFWGDTKIPGLTCAWMSGLSAEGKMAWSRGYRDGQYFNSAQITIDGGIIAAGVYVGDASADALLMKLKRNGDGEWSRAYDTLAGEGADSVQQTRDGGYVIAGPTTLFWSDTDWGDFWAAKITPAGDIEWSYIYRGSEQEGDFSEATRTVDILQTPDGGYILAGDSSSFGAGWADIWIIKLSSAGSIQWQKAYGGKESEWLVNSGPHILSTSDKGYLVACSTLSFGASFTDCWLLKLTPQGDIEWQKKIGGARQDRINSVRSTTDGGYIMAGGSLSFGPDEYLRAWLLKLDSGGDIAWQKTYGKDAHFEAQGVWEALDGGFVIGGYTTSSPGKPFYTDTMRDAFVMKVSPSGQIGPPGTDFVGGSSASVQVTDAVPMDTNVSPLPGTFISYIPVITPTDVSPETKLLCWNLNLPPIEISLKREINRGLFKGEGINTIGWSENPWNTRFHITEYRVYRKVADSADPYQEIGRVPGTASFYVDGFLNLEDKFAYAVTSVAESGLESPLSQAVQNE